MKPRLREAFDAELQSARRDGETGDAARAWQHLERAHVLSQAHAWAHLRVHLLMLRHGWRQRDLHEVLGQLVRVVVAAPGSWLGRAPLGNTGGARVGLFTPMPVPDELRQLVDE